MCGRTACPWRSLIWIPGIPDGMNSRRSINTLTNGIMNIQNGVTKCKTKYGTYKKERTEEERKRNIEKDEEEKRAAAERKKERIRRYREYVKISREIRARVMEKFNSLRSPAEKLAMIAEDKKRLPQYYPFDLQEVRDEELISLDQHILTGLKERFSMLRKKEWKQFYKRLTNVEAGRAG